MSGNVNIFIVPELTSDASAVEVSESISQDIRNAPTGVLILDFSFAQPSPTKYDAVARSIVKAQESKKEMLLAGVSKAVVATSALGRNLAKRKLSLPILDKDRGE